MAKKRTTRATVARKKKSDDRPVVVVTGVAGRLGRELARRLHRKYRVIGLDRRRVKSLPKDVSVHRLDLRSNRTQEIFRANKVKAVFHMGTVYNPRRDPIEDHRTNIVGLQRLLGHVRKYDIPKLVVLSTADVYGPQPENVTFLTEEAPLLAAARFEAIRDLVEVDMATLSFMWQHPTTETVILRPVHVVGAVRNAAMNYLLRDWVPQPAGYDPMVQMVHHEDVVDALLLAQEPGVRGVFNIDGPSALPISQILKHSSKTIVPIPSAFLRAGLSFLWRMRLTRFPPDEVDHIQWPSTVDGRRARDELGYTPKHDLTSILGLLRDGDPLMG
jgi:UDP-glucose 4-epimerase